MLLKSRKYRRISLIVCFDTSSEIFVLFVFLIFLKVDFLLIERKTRLQIKLRVRWMEGWRLGEVVVGSFTKKNDRRGEGQKQVQSF